MDPGVKFRQSGIVAIIYSLSFLIIEEANLGLCQEVLITVNHLLILAELSLYIKV